MQARKTIADMKAYQLPAVTRRDKIRLDLNESGWGCSPAVIEALQQPDRWMISAYPDYDQLYEAIATHYRLPAEAALVTNGADDAIRAVMQTFVADGEKVLLANPSFGMIDIHARVVGAVVCRAEYRSCAHFPLDAFRESLDGGIRLAAIVRPDSPTGAVISRDALQNLLRDYPLTLFVLDETYHHFLGDSCLDLLQGAENLIVLHSLSKAYGLAGCRIGIAFSHPSLIAEMNKVNPPFSVNSMAAFATPVALRDQRYLRQVLDNVDRNKPLLAAGLHELGFETITTSSNFLLVKAPPALVDLPAKLLTYDILIKDLSKYELLKSHFRIAVGSEAQIERLLSALRIIVTQIAPAAENRSD